MWKYDVCLINQLLKHFSGNLSPATRFSKRQLAWPSSSRWNWYCLLCANCQHISQLNIETALHPSLHLWIINLLAKIFGSQKKNINKTSGNWQGRVSTDFPIFKSKRFFGTLIILRKTWSEELERGYLEMRNLTLCKQTWQKWCSKLYVNSFTKS